MKHKDPFKSKLSRVVLLASCFIVAIAQYASAQYANTQFPKVPIVPNRQELQRAFSDTDKTSFKSPSKIYRPETWFHLIGGNVSKDGITRDLEAIAQAGFSGFQMFHGQFGGPWQGVQPQITSLSANWDDAVKHIALEARRLGLRFSMNNCPGWATSGGPWISPSNAMRNLIWNRTDVVGGKMISQTIPMPEPNKDEWRDYKDVTVLAFPTPIGDTGKPLVPKSIKTNTSFNWDPYFKGQGKEPIRLSPSEANKPHWLEVEFADAVAVRSLELSSVQAFNHGQSYEPGVTVTIQGILPDGTIKDILKADMPQSNWQDDQPITLACSELQGVKKYRVSIANKYQMTLSSIKMFSAARKNSWESEAAWTLRSIQRSGEHPKQSPETFIKPEQIIDISGSLVNAGKLNWLAPKGNWTILRLGHVNAGKQNGPAPAEATGWEANKLSKSGARAHFAGYIGRLSDQSGPLAQGLLNGMLIDSWECHTQSWTLDMEDEFKRVSNYALRKWLPALFGYVIKDHETTSKFLTDWRNTLNDLVSNNYYGEMASLARKNGLSVAYETAAGDVLPGDILEYFKHADVPMCEFWQPLSSGFVGSLNFKPIKPTASAARMYGKPRVAAEAFTSMQLTWDEHLEMLKEVANINSVEGVSHYVFHTYTHNPQTPFLAPGSSLGASIGTPFIRGQTWWEFMPDFTTYLSRCTYLLERGKPVSDVLWYLGDELNHKPDQNAPFPSGYKYDYCNPDVLLNRLKVENGMLVTPEGIQYRVLWLPDAPYMRPETLEKLNMLVRNGATIVAEAPVGLSTLSGGEAAQKRFHTAVKAIWGGALKGLRKVGKGYVASGITINQALLALKIKADVVSKDALWSHRRAKGADWYFITAPEGRGLNEDVSFHASGMAEIWDPVTGNVSPIQSTQQGEYSKIKLDLQQAESCFIVFRKGKINKTVLQKTSGTNVEILTNWKLSFPDGWGAPGSLALSELKAWKELDISEEGKAFSGTASYVTEFEIAKVDAQRKYTLDLGKVDMAASVILNGKEVGHLWSAPYRVDLRNFIKQGHNTLELKVTSTWFNRLVFDAGIPEGKRKTWTISGPAEESPLRASGLMGPVKLY